MIRDVPVHVDFEPIKNVHIAVHPPAGRVRVAAPEGMALDAVRLAVIRRWPWVERKRAEFRGAERQSGREMVAGESHYVWGRRYRLRVVERPGRTHLEIDGDRLILYAPKGSEEAERQSVLERWKRAEVRRAAPDLFAKWCGELSLPQPRWGIRKMKTKWGTCSRNNGTIWLNPELAKKHPDCLDYIVLHEMVHLLEPNHGTRFAALLGQHMPDWPTRKDLLNQSPLIDEAWGPEEMGDGH